MKLGKGMQRIRQRYVNANGMTVTIMHTMLSLPVTWLVDAKHFLNCALTVASHT